MNNRLRFAIILVHCIAVLTIAMVLWFVKLASDVPLREPYESSVVWAAAVSLVLAIGVEVTVWKLSGQTGWAWVMRLCLSTRIFPFGVLGLWGLLAAGYRREFGMGVTRATVAVILVLLLQLPGPVVNAKTVSIPETGVTFEAPDGFTPLTTEEIAAKYPRDRPPKFALGNALRTTTIAFELKSTMLSPKQLSEVKSSVESSIEKNVVGIKWIKRELRNIQGWQWIYLESTVPDEEGELHHIVLMTSLHGRQLVVGFNSTKEDFPTVERDIRKCIHTMKLPPP